MARAICAIIVLKIMSGKAKLQTCYKISSWLIAVRNQR